MTSDEGTRMGRLPRMLAAIGLLAGGLAACAIPHWPVEAGEVTSPFGIRSQGVLPGIHRGADIRAAEGTPVRTMAPGTVRFSGWMGGYGNVIWIDHRSDLITVYAHLAERSVEAGAHVESGELIGTSGSTGDVSGPHLHFEVWKSGRQVDPVGFLGRRP